MAVMASASIVVTYRAEARGVTTFWTSKPSTAATPAAPTTTSTDAYVADWSTTMPAYDSSLRCYRVDRVERSDGTCSWGEVTEDQSWAGANSANGTATDAQQVAESAADQAGTAKATATAAQAKADDAWARTLRVEVMSAPADAAGDTSKLTATVWRGGELLSDQTVAMMGLLAWYVGGSRVATGSTYACAAGTAVECRLEA